MEVNRRDFMKVSGAGVVGLSLLQLGVNVKPVRAYVQTLKIEGSKEVISICPFCSCGATPWSTSRTARSSTSRATRTTPSAAAACAPRARPCAPCTSARSGCTKPLYRAPGSAKWEEKDWDWMLDRIARRVKDQRDKDFVSEKRVRTGGQPPGKRVLPGHLPDVQRRVRRGAPVPAQPGHRPHRPPGPGLTQPHRTGSGRVGWTRRNDQSLDRSANADAVLIMGSNCRRTPSHLLPLGDQGQGKGRRGHPRGPQILAHLGPQHLPRAPALRHGHRLPGRHDQVHPGQQEVLRRLRARTTPTPPSSWARSTPSRTACSPVSTRQDRKYDKTWAFEKDDQGLLRNDKTLHDPAA